MSKLKPQPAPPRPHWLMKLGAYSFLSVFLGVFLGVAVLILWSVSIWLWGLGTAWQIAVMVFALLLLTLLIALVGGIITVRREHAEFRKESGLGPSEG